jgi:hypothetical protein
LTDTYDITDVRTGNGFDGNRVAVIYAANGAKPGSLESLTRFFHEQGLNAQLGYTGDDKQHVLRLHGLKSDRALERLLKKDFPVWQQSQDIQHRGTAGFIHFADDLEFSSMGQSPARQKRSFINKIKDKSTELSATAYSAGNLGLVFSAFYGQQKGQNIEWLKLAAPACYSMASAFLFFLNRQKPEARTMVEIWDEISPQLLRDDYVPTAAEAQQLRDQGSSIVGHAWNFMKNHPWEVNGLLNMVGAGSHMTSAIMRRNTTEAVAALSTLTAMGITTFVSEKGPANVGISNTHAFRPLHEGISSASLASASEHGAVLQPFFDAGNKIMDWIQEKPLRAASFIQLAANTGYGAAALTKKDEHGARKTDWGLLATSGAYITGNGFQAIASKNQGPSFDDAVSIAADAIRLQTDWQTQSEDYLRQHVDRIANALSAQPSVGFSSHTLNAGIMERLKRDTPANTSPDAAMIDGFIVTEKDALKDSPFISPHIIESMRTESEVVR